MSKEESATEESPVAYGHGCETRLARHARQTALGRGVSGSGLIQDLPIALAIPDVVGGGKFAILLSAVAACDGHGRLPEWPKGAVCKTVGSAYVGSNPTPATTRTNGP